MLLKVLKWLLGIESGSARTVSEETSQQKPKIKPSSTPQRKRESGFIRAKKFVKLEDQQDDYEYISVVKTVGGERVQYLNCMCILCNRRVNTSEKSDQTNIFVGRCYSHVYNLFHYSNEVRYLDREVRVKFYGSTHTVLRCPTCEIGYVLNLGRAPLDMGHSFQSQCINPDCRELHRLEACYPIVDEGERATLTGPWGTVNFVNKIRIPFFYSNHTIGTSGFANERDGFNRCALDGCDGIVLPAIEKGELRGQCSRHGCSYKTRVGVSLMIPMPEFKDVEEC